MEVPGSGIGETSQPRFPSLNILLVENDPHVVATVKELAVGHEVWNCPSTKHALERLEKGLEVLFDAVILDAEMTNLDAFEFLKRATENKSNIVVILTLTSTSSILIQKAVDCGVGDLWLKPFVKSNILSMEMCVMRKRMLHAKSAFSVTLSSSAEFYSAKSSSSVTSTWKRGLELNKITKKSTGDADVGGGDVEAGQHMENE